ncbi:hypothetical protein Q7C14_14435 [Rossellomorea vietnamensis]|nr:hypothetical protein Q7C14_14435 [Rossellomorea vietnamensis]
MIGGQDGDSYGKSGIGETPQERQRRGGSPSARGKRSLARKSTAVLQTESILILRLGSVCSVKAIIFQHKKTDGHKVHLFLISMITQ